MASSLEDLTGFLESFLGERSADGPTATVGVSGRHVHLNQGDLEALFGAGYELTPVKDLSQPGQFAAKETVALVGPKGVIERVRVLGPVRSQTQVEILAGDSFKLGVPAKVRMSGKLEGTPGITLAGPKGTVAIPSGVMVAARHIHMSLAQAAAMGLHDGQIVSIAFDGERGGRLDNVVIRANDSSELDCHIDTEEANALRISNGSVVRIIK
ncbi:MAG: phosphate propanoyltransferase [Collinsella sp.]|nr:phosphate propanoyltransferase [Collinsella sp.]